MRIEQNVILFIYDEKDTMVREYSKYDLLKLFMKNEIPFVIVTLEKWEQKNELNKIIVNEITNKEYIYTSYKTAIYKHTIFYKNGVIYDKGYFEDYIQKIYQK